MELVPSNLEQPRGHAGSCPGFDRLQPLNSAGEFDFIFFGRHLFLLFRFNSNWKAEGKKQPNFHGHFSILQTTRFFLTVCNMHFPYYVHIEIVMGEFCPFFGQLQHGNSQCVSCSTLKVGEKFLVF